MYILATLTALALVAADQWVKYWTVCRFSAPLAGFSGTGDPALPFLPGLVELTRVHNTGAAWSSFSGMRWLLIGVTTVFLVLLVVLLVKKTVRHPVGVWALFLVIAGGVGNLIDRVRLGYVVDMFHFQWIEFPVFNVADACVVCGTVLAVIYYLWFMKADEKRSSHEDSAAAGEQH